MLFRSDEGSLPLSRVDKDGQMTGTYILIYLNTSSYTQFVVLCWSELNKIVLYTASQRLLLDYP